MREMEMRRNPETTESESELHKICLIVGLSWRFRDSGVTAVREYLTRGIRQRASYGHIFTSDTWGWRLFSGLLSK